MVRTVTVRFEGNRITYTRRTMIREANAQLIYADAYGGQDLI
jgi:hypothetical protein